MVHTVSGTVKYHAHENASTIYVSVFEDACLNIYFFRTFPLLPFQLDIYFQISDVNYIPLKFLQFGFLICCKCNLNVL